MKKKTDKPVWGVKCAECARRIFSFHVHDYRLCGCPNETMVDGGREYLRFGWKTHKPKRVKWTEKLDGVFTAPKYKHTFPR